MTGRDGKTYPKPQPKPTPPPSVYFGPAHAKRQINALETIKNDLTAHSVVLEHLFPPGRFERTCTPEVAREYARDFEAALKHFNRLVKNLRSHGEPDVRPNRSNNTRRYT